VCSPLRSSTFLPTLGKVRLHVHTYIGYTYTCIHDVLQRHVCAHLFVPARRFVVHDRQARRVKALIPLGPAIVCVTEHHTFVLQLA